MTPEEKKFLSEVKCWYNAFTDLETMIDAWKEGVFKDVPSQAFDVGVDEEKRLRGAMPTGPAGEQLRKDARENGATVGNPLMPHHVENTKRHFFTLLDDPLGEMAERKNKADDHLTYVYAQIDSYVELLQGQIDAAVELQTSIISTIEQWSQRPEIPLYIEPTEWDNSNDEVSPELFLTALSLEAAMPKSGDRDWDEFLCAAVKMDRAQIETDVERVCQKALAYLESRKKGKGKQAEVAPVVNARKLR